MIFYFTGTGNSLYAAKHFDKELYSIPQEMKKNSRKYKADRIGIVCPLYEFDLPVLVKDFILGSEFETEYFYIVMTYGMTNDIRFGGLQEFTAKEFETVLVDELVPYIDANFQTKSDKWNRAMAGLSMGGFETKLITLRRPEVFGYYGLLIGGQYEPKDIKDKKQVKVIFQSCGSKERPDAIKESTERLKAAGFNAHGYVSEGTAHEFLTWRRSLYQMAQILFK